MAAAADPAAVADRAAIVDPGRAVVTAASAAEIAAATAETGVVEIAAEIAAGSKVRRRSTWKS